MHRPPFGVVCGGKRLGLCRVGGGCICGVGGVGLGWGCDVGILVRGKEMMVET